MLNIICIKWNYLIIIRDPAQKLNIKKLLCIMWRSYSDINLSSKALKPLEQSTYDVQSNENPKIQISIALHVLQVAQIIRFASMRFSQRTRPEVIISNKAIIIIRHRIYKSIRLIRLIVDIGTSGIVRTTINGVAWWRVFVLDTLLAQIVYRYVWVALFINTILYAIFTRTR